MSRKRRRNPVETVKDKHLAEMNADDKLSADEKSLIRRLVANAPDNISWHRLDKLIRITLFVMRVYKLDGEEVNSYHRAELLDYLIRTPMLSFNTQLNIHAALRSYRDHDWKKFPVLLLYDNTWNPESFEITKEVYAVIMRFLRNLNSLIWNLSLGEDDHNLYSAQLLSYSLYDEYMLVKDEVKPELLHKTPVVMLMADIANIRNLTLAKFEEAITEYKTRIGAVNRTRDRLAQIKPSWAISEYPEQFETGKSLATIYLRIIQELERARRAKQRHRTTVSTKFVIHGRDGEMIYSVAKKLAPDLYKQMVYVLTPRALTAERQDYHFTDTSRDYDEYLKRLISVSVPQVHVDTGFQGSVPKWFESSGWNVRNILLVSSSVKEFGLLPESYGETSEARELRDRVTSEIEHSPQRLVTLTGTDTEQLSRYAKWGKWHYSKDAPGFWARYYGVLSGLGIPEKNWNK